MKRLAVIAVAAILAGCCLWRKSPYDSLDNWLIREDAVRQFSVAADVIYLQGTLYTNITSLSTMTTYALDEVGRGRFGGVARVFSPLVANADDVESAIEWYFCLRHGIRPFVFIGEGEGGALLKAYEEENAESLKDKGLLMSFYTDGTHEGFVSDGMVRMVREAVVRWRYREQWGREAPGDEPRK